VIRGNREISRPLLHQAASISVLTVIGVLGPGLAASVGLQPNQLIVVVLPLGIGVIVGVLGLRRFAGGVSRRRAAEGGLIALGLLTLVVAAAGTVSIATGGTVPIIPLIVASALLAGSAYSVTSVSAQTALFEHLPAAVRGRVFGVLASIVSAASLGPTIVAGPLADRVSAPAVAAGIGVLAVIAGFASYRFFGPTEGAAVAVD
jgi:MFS family permease